MLLDGNNDIGLVETSITGMTTQPCSADPNSELYSIDGLHDSDPNVNLRLTLSLKLTLTYLFVGFEAPTAPLRHRGGPAAIARAVVFLVPLHLQPVTSVR